MQILWCQIDMEPPSVPHSPFLWVREWGTLAGANLEKMVGILRLDPVQRGGTSPPAAAASRHWGGRRWPRSGRVGESRRGRTDGVRRSSLPRSTGRHGGIGRIMLIKRDRGHWIDPGSGWILGFVGTDGEPLQGGRGDQIHSFRTTSVRDRRGRDCRGGIIIQGGVAEVASHFDGRKFAS